MVKIAQCFCFAGASAFFIFALQAKDLATYRIGDIAETAVTTPVALDVIDPAATAARKAAEALKTPAVFRSFPEAATNTMAREFAAAFAAERTEFLAANKNIFPAPTNDSQTNAAPDFAEIAANFNRRKISFPITTSLAENWARGDHGLAVQNQLLDSLLQISRRPIVPDNLPAGFVAGEILRFVDVSDPKENLTLADAEQRGKLIMQSSLVTIGHLRSQFRREFSDDRQNLARALANFLKPNCAPDENLTQQARDRDVRQLVVANHYEAGQIIVQRGAPIDAKIKAALDQLNEKLMPAQLNSQIAAQREQIQQAQTATQREQEQARQAQADAQSARVVAQAAHAQAVKMHDQTLALQSQALQIRARNEWLVAALAGISAIALLAFWWLARNRRQALSVPIRAENLLPQNAVAFPAALAPQLAQVLKEAVIQGLAAQRSELLQAQQSAAAEISGLVQRLDELKAPMQDRLRSYEVRIQELEKDLAERNEENRELLKLKIEMIRRQLETERARNRADFN